MNSNDHKPVVLNNRWKRESTDEPNSTNPFNRRLRGGVQEAPRENSRWKRSEGEKFNNKPSNRGRAYRPPSKRRMGRERFYSRRDRDREEKPKKKTFNMCDTDFPSLGGKTKALENVKLPVDSLVGGWRDAALKGQAMPDASRCQKTEVKSQHIIPQTKTSNEEIDWSDEERQYCPEDDEINKFDEIEYDHNSGMEDDTDDMIF